MPLASTGFGILITEERGDPAVVQCRACKAKIGSGTMLTVADAISRLISRPWNEYYCAPGCNNAVQLRIKSLEADDKWSISQRPFVVDDGQVKHVV